MVAKQVIAALLIAVLAVPAHADCREFFVKRAVVHHAVVQQVAVPYAVPYYQPPIYYSAGADIQAEALAEKVSRLVEKKLSLRQPQTAPAPLAKPVQTGAFAKCATCHSGASPAGGVILDGVHPITCDTYWRWGEIAGLGKDVPEKMKALVGSMTPEQKGAINEALLNLPKAEHILPAPAPPLPPRPDGELQ